MHQTEPQKVIPLVFKITDPFDSNTYYVRAVVRDSLTGEILKTINLTDQGNLRHTAQYTTPVDGTGLGRHIDITKSDSYREEVDYWLVRAQSLSFGGGGEDGIDYDYLEKIFNKLLDQRFKPLIELLAKLKPADIAPVMKKLHKIHEKLKEVPEETINEEETKVDFSPVIEFMGEKSKEILAAVDKLPKEPTEKTDIKPVLDAIAQSDRVMGEKAEKMIEAIEEVDENKKIIKRLQKSMESIMKEDIKVEVEEEIEEEEKIKEEEKKREEPKTDLIKNFL